MKELEEIKLKQTLLLAALLESKGRAEQLTAKIEPLQQQRYKEQEITANIRLEYNRIEFQRAQLEKPSPETEKMIKVLIKQHNLSRSFALEVIANLRQGI